MDAERSAVLRLTALTRPKGAWLIATLPVTGFGYGLWERGSTVSPFVVAPTIGLLFGAWLVGHAGAMWLNAELDRDSGAVLFGRAVPVPRHTALAGYAALAGSVALATPLGVVPATCAGLCAILSIAYSHPATALKASPLGGPLVNGLGYATLSPLAGFAASGTAQTWRAALALAIAVAFILGTYFAAQAFQGEEDRARGYRTLVATHGPRWTLTVSRACLLLGMTGLTATSLAGVYPRALLASVPIWWWADRQLVSWRRIPGGGDGRQAARLVLRLALGALVLVGAAYADHFTKLAMRSPAGGCGTAVVPQALHEVCVGK